MIKSQCQCHALPSLVFIPQSNGYGYSSQSSMVAEFYVLLINYNSRRWSCRFSRSEYWQTSEWLHFVFKPLLKEHVYFLALAFSYSVHVNLCQKLFFLQNMGRTCCVQKMFWMSTISVHNMFSPGLNLEFSLIELVIQWTFFCRHIVG